MKKLPKPKKSLRNPDQAAKNSAAINPKGWPVKDKAEPEECRDPEHDREDPLPTCPTCDADLSLGASYEDD